ncbi:hypothetical protein [Maricaulis sp.]|uniref:hypothetical protein n=1 Tax=Maricaulis sp. TaxID=1486257 RepID=UPI0025BEB567|nr:hypothetical protein [Maricaulis sp.]
MILTSITKALKTQNWLAVAVEFIIVLAGVVIGFQISAWNETRIEHQREALILDRLHADFVEIEARTATMVAQLETRIEAGTSFETLLLRDQTFVSDADFFEALQNAIGTPVPNGRSATYAELVASGEMRLIRSEALREALVEFDEQVRRQELAYASLARLITDNAGLLLEVQGYAVEDPEALRPDLYRGLAEIRQSPEIFTAARLTTRANQVNRIWHEGTLERAQAVLAAMETGDTP